MTCTKKQCTDSKKVNQHKVMATTGKPPKCCKGKSTKKK